MMFSENEMKEHIHISIVSPVYRGEKMVAELVRRNVESVSAITDDYEIILVNDASPDNSWEEIVKQCESNPKVKGINLSRNFGQHYAITAGLHYAKGEWVVVMDCDLQDRPEDIPNLYNKAKEGYDIVYARRVVKHVGWLKRFSSVAFHTVFDWLSGSKTDSAIGNFGIYCNKIIKEYVKIPEYVRTFSVLISTLGFKTTTLEVTHAEREEGHSSYTLSKLLKLTYNIMISNSNKPLRMAVSFGFIMSAIAFILALYNVIAKCFGLIDVPGYTFTVFSIWFACGIQLIVMGMLGLYIGKIFDQVKGRPSYIIRDILNAHTNGEQK